MDMDEEEEEEEYDPSKKTREQWFSERATDKCGQYRCKAGTNCSCRDWADKRYNLWKNF